MRPHPSFKRSGGSSWKKISIVFTVIVATFLAIQFFTIMGSYNRSEDPIPFGASNKPGEVALDKRDTVGEAILSVLSSSEEVCMLLCYYYLCLCYCLLLTVVGLTPALAYSWYRKGGSLQWSSICTKDQLSFHISVVELGQKEEEDACHCTGLLQECGITIWRNILGGL